MVKCRSVRLSEAIKRSCYGSNFLVVERMSEVRIRVGQSRSKAGSWRERCAIEVGSASGVDTQVASAGEALNPRQQVASSSLRT